MKPRGATELQMEMLNKHVSKELLDQVQICTSIPGKVPLDPNKLNIFGKKILMINLIFKNFLKIKKDIKNMIGMFLTAIGTMKNLDIFLNTNRKISSYKKWY